MGQPDRRNWSEEPADARVYTAEFDRFYTRFSRLYDRLLKIFPIWRNWIEAALPCIEGSRVLEVGFGTGYLMTQFAGNCEAYGVDMNLALIEIARDNLRRAGVTANLQQANVEQLPFPANFFDTVLSTVAFTGFPDGERAMAEITRVLKPEGRLVLVDVALPPDGNLLGTVVASGFAASGDILRDMLVLFERFGYECEATAVGGSVSIQRYCGRLRDENAHTAGAC